MNVKKFLMTFGVIGWLRNVTVILLLIFASSCVATNYVMLGNATARTPTQFKSVAIYRTANQVPGKYEEVSLINSAGAWGWSSEKGMYRSMQKKAASIGANAIILDSMSEPSAGAKVAAAIFGVGAERKGKAIAIYIFPKK